MRYFIAVLALAGVVVSALALHVHFCTDPQPCSINERWDCGVVNHSPFAEIAHIPVAPATWRWPDWPSGGSGRWSFCARWWGWALPSG
jgi:hypothetical protein